MTAANFFPLLLCIFPLMKSSRRSPYDASLPSGMEIPLPSFPSFLKPVASVSEKQLPLLPAVTENLRISSDAHSNNVLHDTQTSNLLLASSSQDLFLRPLAYSSSAPVPKEQSLAPPLLLPRTYDGSLLCEDDLQKPKRFSIPGIVFEPPYLQSSSGVSWLPESTKSSEHLPLPHGDASTTSGASKPKDLSTLTFEWPSTPVQDRFPHNLSPSLACVEEDRNPALIAPDSNTHCITSNCKALKALGIDSRPEVWSSAQHNSTTCQETSRSKDDRIIADWLSPQEGGLEDWNHNLTIQDYHKILAEQYTAISKTQPSSSSLNRKLIQAPLLFKRLRSHALIASNSNHKPGSSANHVNSPPQPNLMCSADSARKSSGRLSKYRQEEVQRLSDRLWRKLNVSISSLSDRDASGPPNHESILSAPEIHITTSKLLCPTCHHLATRSVDNTAYANAKAQLFVHENPRTAIQPRLPSQPRVQTPPQLDYFSYTPIPRIPPKSPLRARQEFTFPSRSTATRPQMTRNETYPRRARPTPTKYKHRDQHPSTPTPPSTDPHQPIPQASKPQTTHSTTQPALPRFNPVHHHLSGSYGTTPIIPPSWHSRSSCTGSGGRPKGETSRRSDERRREELKRSIKIVREGC